MEFKLWLEIVELRKPENRVIKRNIIKDSGTSVAHPCITYNWVTPIGNKIQLQFTPEGHDVYNIMFYVNNTLYDYASKKPGYDRDVDILPNVFHLIKDKADRLKAQELKFTGYTSKDTRFYGDKFKDTPVIDREKRRYRNLDINQYKPSVIQELNNFLNYLKTYEIKFKPHSPVLDKILKIDTKKSPRPDLDKEVWGRWYLNILEKINNNEDIEDNINQLKSGWGRLPSFSIDNLSNILDKFNLAVQSNREQGVEVNHNRRTAIYARILNKYFLDKWDIKIDKNNFILTRKQNNATE